MTVCHWLQCVCGERVSWGIPSFELNSVCLDEVLFAGNYKLFPSCFFFASWVSQPNIKTAKGPATRITDYIFLPCYMCLERRRRRKKIDGILGNPSFLQEKKYSKSTRDDTTVCVYERTVFELKSIKYLCSIPGRGGEGRVFIISFFNLPQSTSFPSYDMGGGGREGRLD